MADERMFKEDQRGQGLYLLGTHEKIEPLIKLRVGPQQQEIEFLVDSGAERSTVQTLPQGCDISSEKIEVIGAKGEPFKVPVVKNVLIESNSKLGIGSFLLVPEAEYNLLGRDLMIELGIGLEVLQGELKIKLCPLRTIDEEKINPEVWYTPETIGKLKQYPLSMEGKKGLKPEIQRFPIQYPHFTCKEI